MNQINAYTVCVNYADILTLSIDRWKQADSLIVITDTKDEATLALTEDHGVELWQTDVFYENRAFFNKGAAISECYGHRPPKNWSLFFDADVIPPENWREIIEPKDPADGRIHPGFLYGAQRHDEQGVLIQDCACAGFFQLFNVSDFNAQRRPIVDTHWSHAGNYDSEFKERWAVSQRVTLPLHLKHIGTPMVNWCGRGNFAPMSMLLSERRKRGGFSHERIAEEPRP